MKRRRVAVVSADIVGLEIETLKEERKENEVISEEVAKHDGNAGNASNVGNVSNKKEGI